MYKITAKTLKMSYLFPYTESKYKISVKDEQIVNLNRVQYHTEHTHLLQNWSSNKY